LNEAKEQKADKIHICANSAEETIGFYKKLDAVRQKNFNRVYTSSIQEICILNIT